jgi:hypothetical protein
VAFDDNNKPVMSLEEMYTMHEEYAEYRFDKFKERLKSIRKIVVEMDSRAEADELALELYISKHSISYSNWKGLIQWQGSGAQEAAWSLGQTIFSAFKALIFLIVPHIFCLAQ